MRARSLTPPSPQTHKHKHVTSAAHTKDVSSANTVFKSYSFYRQHRTISSTVSNSNSTTATNAFAINTMSTNLIAMYITITTTTPTTTPATTPTRTTTVFSMFLSPSLSLFTIARRFPLSASRRWCPSSTCLVCQRRSLISSHLRTSSRCHAPHPRQNPPCTLQVRKRAKLPEGSIQVCERVKMAIGGEHQSNKENGCARSLVYFCICVYTCISVVIVIAVANAILVRVDVYEYASMCVRGCVGCGIQADVKKLEKEFGFRCAGVCDLAH
eukprot:2267294-Pleurochrysis_carterae.AAC.3